MHLFLKKIYRKNPFPKIYRINQCEVLNKELFINMKPFVGKQAHILLMNQYGQLIKDVTLSEIDETPVRMEVGDIPNGIYWLTIQPSGGLRGITKKLVVGKMY